MSISNGPNRFGFLKFVIVIYLLFAIWNFSPKPKSFFLDQLAAFQASGWAEPCTLNRSVYVRLSFVNTIELLFQFIEG